MIKFGTILFFNFLSNGSIFIKICTLRATNLIFQLHMKNTEVNGNFKKLIFDREM